MGHGYFGSVEMELPRQWDFGIAMCNNLSGVIKVEAMDHGHFESMTSWNHPDFWNGGVAIGNS